MSSPLKKSAKRKAIEEEVLSKARKYVKLASDETGQQEPAPDVPTIKMDLAPKVKLRKPRTGKKEKTGETQAVPNPAVTEDKSVGKTKSKKKKKRNKKKKPPQQALPVSEGAQKHAREALQFLQKWNSDRNGWKFEKLKQIWLLKNALKSEAIDEDNFLVLLKYVASMKGRGRQVFLHEMEDAVNKFEEAFPASSESTPSPEEKVKYDRARQLVQMLYDEDMD